ncbi:MAG: hypothetical protein E6I52_22470 [Chloroflexi bacterium]|nr:MAG: hypothetical protein E6I52_22470 [Chloroflexota bacterium]
MPHTPPDLDASSTARDLDSGLAVRYPRVGGRGHSRGEPAPVGDSLADPHTPPDLDAPSTAHHLHAGAAFGVHGFDARPAAN